MIRCARSDQKPYWLGSALKGRGDKGVSVKAFSRVLCALGLLTSLAVVLPFDSASFAATASHRTFYLDLRPGQCAIDIPGLAKFERVVPCNNPSHDLEVYRVTHGGWTSSTRPSDAIINARARQVCLSSFQSITGAVMRSPYGYRDYFPDAGAESAKYGDRFICGLTRWPRIGPMGPGTHVHATG